MFHIKYYHPSAPKESWWSGFDQAQELEKFKQTIHSKEIGFFRLPLESHFSEESISLYEKIIKSRTIKHFVHLGIGGSSLGPELLVKSLRDYDHSTKFHFINNIDPDAIWEILQQIDVEQTLFFVVSKSGGTAEIVSGLSLIYQFLIEKGLKEKEARALFAFCTDPLEGDLLAIAKDWDVPYLTIPQDVGGRYCVLSSVGLFPALFAGLDIQRLLLGAKKMAEEILETPSHENELITLAGLLYSLKKEGITQTVLMPYSSKLREISFWFSQLWSESLGKKHNKNGIEVFEGLTPLVSYGATDQHSQMQLFMHGPKDKCLLFLEVEQFDHDFSLKNSISGKTFEKLSPFTLSQLMKAELMGTVKALEKEARPYAHLVLPKRDEFHLGALILLLESLTVLTGQLLNVDPFDQPGVEQGKIFAYEFLGE